MEGHNLESDVVQQGFVIVELYLLVRYNPWKRVYSGACPATHKLYLHCTQCVHTKYKIALSTPLKIEVLLLFFKKNKKQFSVAYTQLGTPA